MKINQIVFWLIQFMTVKYVDDKGQKNRITQAYEGNVKFNLYRFLFL